MSKVAVPLAREVRRAGYLRERGTSLWLIMHQKIGVRVGNLARQLARQGKVRKRSTLARRQKLKDANVEADIVSDNLLPCFCVSCKDVDSHLRHDFRDCLSWDAMKDVDCRSVVRPQMAFSDMRRRKRRLSFLFRKFLRDECKWCKKDLCSSRAPGSISKLTEQKRLKVRGRRKEEPERGQKRDGKGTERGQKGDEKGTETGFETYQCLEGFESLIYAETPNSEHPSPI